MPREQSGRSRAREGSERHSDLSSDRRKRESEPAEDRVDSQGKRARTDRSSERPSESSRCSRNSRPLEARKGFDPSVLDPDNPEDLVKFLGFSDFKSTKGLKVPGNNVGAMDIKKKRREYTQMLHRRKLYEIPLTRQQLAEKEAAAQSQMQD